MGKFKNTIDTMLSVALMVTIIASIITVKKNTDMLRCRLDVVNARIDRLEGREPTMPECVEAFMGKAVSLRSHALERRT